MFSEELRISYYNHVYIETYVGTYDITIGTLCHTNNDNVIKYVIRINHLYTVR